MILCNYGCGQEAKYQFKNGKWCCSCNYQQCSQGKKLNPRTDEWKQNHSKIMKGHPSLTKKRVKGAFKHTKENKKKQSERMKTNNPMKNPETVLKNIETRKRNGTTGLGRQKPKHLCEQYRKRMLENNPMKDPEIVMKNFRNHTNNKSGPEIYLEKVLNYLNIQYEYVGDGKLFVNGKCPDFIITNAKKLIEVYDSSFHYSGQIRDNIWLKSRRSELNGYEVLFIDFYKYGKAKRFSELCSLLNNYIN